MRWGSADDAESAAVVAAAFALIDEAYATASRHADASPPRSRDSRKTRRDELRELRAQVADLEFVLAQLHRRHAFGPLDGSSVAALWAQVAYSQLYQLREAISDNERLRECVETQRVLATQLHQATETMCALVGASSVQRHKPQPVPVSVLSAPLTNRLDAIAVVAGSEWMGLTPRSVDAVFRDCHAQLSSAGDGLRIQYRFAGFVPFKLSLVASEVWEFILNNAFGTQVRFTEQSGSPNEAFGQLTMELNMLTAPRLEIQGNSALRRVYTADGSVVFAAATIAPGSVATNNLMEGFELHELSWLRVGRSPTAPKSIVYIESFCRLDIIPTQTSVCELKLRRIRDAMVRTSEALGPRNMQQLENRLLDATRRQQSVPYDISEQIDQSLRWNASSSGLSTPYSDYKPQ